MKIFDTKDIRDIDAYTIKHEPVSSVDLMERAASGCAEWIKRNVDRNSPVAVFTGPGNNGGDGWAIARILNDNGYREVGIYHLQISHVISTDSVINRDRLISQGKSIINNIESVSDFPILHPDVIIIDALFGSGLSRPLDGLSADLVKHVNSMGCMVISIDIPSGLFGEDNSHNTDMAIIKATHTLTFQFPKRSFFYSENEKYTGLWHVIPIGLNKEILETKQTEYFFTTLEDIKLRKRKIFSHKGNYGHGLLIAGSYGMMGAAILAARACLRTGIGLLTTHVPASGYPIIQSSVPESIFSIDTGQQFFSLVPSFNSFSAIAAGPGISTSTETVLALKSLIKSCNKPLVLDADALTILSLNPEMIKMLPAHTILTPHPGEFDRITGVSENGFIRNQKQIEFSKQYHVIIILKGANTSVTFPDGKCLFNSTGNPGMATAGSGDVLLGMVLSLLAQGYSPEEAAVNGVFLHGLAGDLARNKSGESSLIASDIIDNIGIAFGKIIEYEKKI
jgi:NAD(P)H-hydrate epimerase